jgi:tetratricopeptide (TPR) repeat protein
MTIRRDWQIMALLAAATIAVFWQVSWHEFVNFDDPAYVTYNPVVREGLTWPGVVWAFTNLHGEATYWHPVTWLSHMLDCQLYGVKPAGHHLTNLFLHTLNTVLLFVVLRRMTGRRGASAMVAALFALHPLQVDSVAWISERKNVLSTLFFMLTLWAYVRYAEGRREKADPSSVAAPVLRSPAEGGLRRVESRKQKAENGSRNPVTRNTQHATRIHLPSSTFYLLSLSLFALGLMSKPTLVPLPFLLLLLDYWPLGRIAERGMRSADSRITHHASRITFHVSLPLLVEKLPFLALSAASSLVTIRAHTSLGGLVSTEELPISLRLANAPVACAIYLRKLFWPVDLSVFYLHPGRWPEDAIAGSTLLLLGITAVAIWQARRRPYLIVGWLWFLGMLVPVSGLVQAHVQALADRFVYVPAIGVFVMVVWAAAEWFGRLAATTAGNHKAQKSICGLPLLGYGVAALVLAGCVVMTSLQLRHWRNSVTLLQRVVQVEPGSYLARVMLGNALFERRELDGALGEYQAGLRLRPDAPDGWERAGVVLTEQGRPAEAMPYLLKAVELAPAWPEAQRRLALAWQRQGRIKEAQDAYQKLVTLMPNTAEGCRNLADMLAEGQQFAQAVNFYREALRLKPEFEAALNNLAMLRASCPQPEFRNGAEAVQFAENACRLSRRRNPSFLGTLAAAYAEAGRFDDAFKTIQEALAVAKASGADDLVPIQTRMLEQFRAGKPYR